MTITFPIYLWKCVFYGYFFRPQEQLALETLPTEGPLPPFPQVLILGGNEGHIEDQSHGTPPAIDAPLPPSHNHIEDQSHDTSDAPNEHSSPSKGCIENQSHDTTYATNESSLLSEGHTEDQSHDVTDTSDAFNELSLPSPKVKTPTKPIVGGMWNYMLGVGSTPSE